MKEFQKYDDEDFITAYGVGLNYGEDGKPNGKLHTAVPVQDLDFIGEILGRKPRLMDILLPKAGYKRVTLWLVAYGYKDDAGNRLEGYSVMHATLIREEAERIVQEDLDSVPESERDGATVYIDGYDLILPADDNRTADELVRDIYMSNAWPYRKDVDALTEAK